MYNERDILARLQKGESVDDIAKEITEVLNNANSTYKKEQEAARKVQETKKQKIKDMQTVVELFVKYIKTYYPDLYTDYVNEADTEAVVKGVVEGLDKEFKSLSALKTSLSKISASKKESNSKSIDDMLQEFLDKTGW